MNANLNDSQRGTSLIELLVVLVIISIGATISLFAFARHRKAYNTEDQALQVLDILQKAKQFAITKRRTMRVEVNLDRNIVRLIDENQPNSAGDDQEIASVVLRDASLVKIGNNSVISSRPTNVSLAPPQSSPCPDALYKPSVHPSSVGQNTFTLRFMRNGSVTSAGVDAIGTNSIVSGATLYVWEPAAADANQAKDLALVRAITVGGISGSIQYWKHETTNTGGIANSGWRNNYR